MSANDVTYDEDAAPFERGSCSRCGSDMAGEPRAAVICGACLDLEEEDERSRRRYPDWAYRAPYTHLATVRGREGVPVRKSGRYWVCAVQIDYGYYWGATDVRDVEPLTVRA